MSESRDLLSRTSSAIHTLFYATEAAHERHEALRAAVETDEELAAFQALSIGLLNFEPLPPEVLEGARRLYEEAMSYTKPAGTLERIAIEVNESEDGQYVRRLLSKMYSQWSGTLDYERGIHRLIFYSPFDEKLRRVTIFASVSVDGESADLRARTYVLGPYLSVEDYRTHRKSDDPWKVLSGDLTPILPEAGND